MGNNVETSSCGTKWSTDITDITDIRGGTEENREVFRGSICMDTDLNPGTDPQFGYGVGSQISTLQGSDLRRIHPVATHFTELYGPIVG
jgi:hypothetical protein